MVAQTLEEKIFCRVFNSSLKIITYISDKQFALHIFFLDKCRRHGVKWMEKHSVVMLLPSGVMLANLSNLFESFFFLIFKLSLLG